MAISAFIIMNALEAAKFRDETANDTNRLDPILIRGGANKGHYVLPLRVKTDPVFADRWDAFNMCEEIALDTAEAFPPVPI